MTYQRIELSSDELRFIACEMESGSSLAKVQNTMAYLNRRREERHREILVVVHGLEGMPSAVKQPSRGTWVFGSAEQQAIATQMDLFKSEQDREERCRTEALRLALSATSGTGKTVPLAEEYYQFLKGTPC